ncbi:MAG: nuclear transport factor 2 family protein [Acidimicrobiales bacterium]
MADYQMVAARYIDAWNERDATSRKDAVNALWSDDASYTDPLVTARGADEIDATIAAVQGQFPTFDFRLTGAVDGHHGQCRFGWELGPLGADAPVAGFDVAVLGDDGRIQAVFGFLDRVPAS